MTILSIDALRQRIETPASDSALGDLLDRIEADIVRHLGNPYVNATTPVSETHRGDGYSLFLKRRILSVDTVTEYILGASGWTPQALTEGSDFLVWNDEGRLERRQMGWRARVVVAYVPQDDRPAWKEAELDLARIALSRSALKSESVGGEYSFTAPDDWEVEKARVLQRLGFVEL